MLCRLPPPSTCPPCRGCRAGVRPCPPPSRTQGLSLPPATLTGRGCAQPRIAPRTTDSQAPGSCAPGSSEGKRSRPRQKHTLWVLFSAMSLEYSPHLLHFNKVSVFCLSSVCNSSCWAGTKRSPVTWGTNSHQNLLKPPASGHRLPPPAAIRALTHPTAPRDDRGTRHSACPQRSYRQRQQDQRNTLPPTAQRQEPDPSLLLGAARSSSATAETPAGSDPAPTSSGLPGEHAWISIRQRRV